jgi:predicted FMN-binding regulatory protein PaiB
MYIPDPYKVDDTTLIHDFIRSYSLATLIIFGAGNLEANHLPLFMRKKSDQNIVLEGH